MDMRFETRKGPKDIIKHFLKTLLKTLFLVGAGLVFALTLSAFISPEMIDGLKKNISAPLLIVYAELIGFIAPGPRYIIYPILAKLAEFSVGAGVIIALIGGHVLIEPSTAFIEAGFFGYRFPIKRFIVSFIITFIAGMLTVILYNYFGLRIL
jgi:uncharacterized membrane protein YraQ (UPF0718 family)